MTIKYYIIINTVITAFFSELRCEYGLFNNAFFSSFNFLAFSYR